MQGDGGVGNAFPLDFQPLFGLYRLMQPVRPAAAELEPAGELVDDDHFPILHHIILVPLLLNVGGQGILDVVNQMKVFRVVQVADPRPPLHIADALLGQGNGLGAVVDGVIRIMFQPGGQLGKGIVMLHRLLGRAADNQGSARLVNQDVVHFVDDGVTAQPLHPLRRLDRHIVPQVVKAELAVRAVQHIAAIGIPPADRAQAGQPLGGVRNCRVVLIGGVVLEAAHGQAQVVIDWPHPHRIPAGQVVVDGDDMDAVAGQGIEIDRQSSHQGFALAGFHFGNLPPVQGDAANQLHIVMALAQDGRPAGRFPDGGKGFRQQILQAFPGGQPFPKAGGLPG